MKIIARLWKRAEVRWMSLAVGVAMIVYGIVLIAGSPVHILAPAKEDLLVLTAKPVGEVGLTSGQVAIMERMYRDAYDIDIAKTLLDQYTAKGNYQQAYDLLGHIEEKGQLSQLDQSLVSRIVYNLLFDTVPVDAENLLGSASTSQTARILRALAAKDYATYTSIMQAFTTAAPAREPLLVALQQADQTYLTLKSAPAYYHTGLIAATLMQAGYIPYAASIAQDLLKADDTYILAYEILSQAAIKQQHYTDAIMYLQKLFTLDKQHVERTAFFLGMSYYFSHDYDQALLYLQQITDVTYLYDAQRYMILTFYQQGMSEQMMDGFRMLLHAKKLIPTDYVLLYDIIFYEPYRRGEVGGTGADFSLLHTYAIPILIPYIDSCKKTIAHTAPYVCRYGEAGRYLSQGNAEKALKDLLYVSKMYPNPVIFQALGDYYKQQGAEQKAQLFYAKALMTSK